MQICKVLAPQPQRESQRGHFSCLSYLQSIWATLSITRVPHCPSRPPLNAAQILQMIYLGVIQDPPLGFAACHVDICLNHRGGRRAGLSWIQKRLGAAAEVVPGGGEEPSVERVELERRWRIMSHSGEKDFRFCRHLRLGSGMNEWITRNVWMQSNEVLILKTSLWAGGVSPLSLDLISVIRMIC